MERDTVPKLSLQKESIGRIMFAGLDKHGGGVVGNMVTDRKFTTITMGESAETARYLKQLMSTKAGYLAL